MSEIHFQIQFTETELSTKTPKLINCEEIQLFQRKLITISLNDFFFEKYPFDEFQWEIETDEKEIKTIEHQKNEIIINYKQSSEFHIIDTYSATQQKFFKLTKMFSFTIEPRQLNNGNEITFKMKLFPSIETNENTIQMNENYLLIQFKPISANNSIDQKLVTIKTDERLGKGAEAIIYGAIYNGNDVVVKKFKESQYGNNLPHIMNSLKQHNHENIIKFYGFFVDQNSCMNLVIERAITSFDKCYCEYDDTINCSILQDVIRGIEYIHQMNFVHLDIKPDNILIFETPKGLVGKISDFGTTQFGKEGITADGTALYIAPECLNQNKYSTKSDIFSFGRTIEVVLGRYSKEKIQNIGNKLMKIDYFNNNKIFNKDEINNYQPQLLHSIERVNNLIQQCCIKEPEQRIISYDEIYKQLEAIKQLIFADNKHFIDFGKYHIFKGECTIESSFQAILKEFEKETDFNSTNYIDKEVKFQLKLNALKKLENEIINFDETESTEDKLELLKLRYKLMKEALEKLLNQLEIERQEGKYQLRFGNEEYEIAMNVYSENDDTLLKIKDQMMIKSAKKGNIKAILYIKDKMEKLYNQLTKKELVEEIEFKNNFNKFLSKMKEKNEMLKYIQKFDIENKQGITEKEAFELIDILSTVSITAKIEKVKWLIHGKGTAINYHEAINELKRIEKMDIDTTKINNIIKEIHSILEFTQINKKEEFKTQNEQKQKWEKSFETTLKMNSKTDYIVANQFVLHLEKERLGLYDRTKLMKNKSFFDSQLMENNKMKLNQFVYQLNISNGKEKKLFLSNIMKMAEENDVDAIEYLVEWLMKGKKLKEINLMISSIFMKMNIWRNIKLQNVTIKTIQLYYLMKGVSLMSKYCIKQLSKQLLSIGKHNKSTHNQMIKVAQRMIHNDAINGRRKALKLIIDCHLQLNEPQTALKFTTKSIEHVDEKSIKIGVEIIKSSIQQNPEIFEEMRSLQHKYLQKLSLLNESLGRKLRKEASDVAFEQLKMNLRKEYDKMKFNFENSWNDSTKSEQEQQEMKQQNKELKEWAESILIGLQEEENYNLFQMKSQIERNLDEFQSEPNDYAILMKAFLIELLKHGITMNEIQMNCLIVFAEFVESKKIETLYQTAYNSLRICQKLGNEKVSDLGLKLSKLLKGKGKKNFPGYCSFSSSYEKDKN